MTSDHDDDRPLKPLFWVGSSRDDLREFPDNVRAVFGFALYQAQLGGIHLLAKPLKGFDGAGVLEVIADDDGSTFRCVYTVKLSQAVYVLDAFQKKSKKRSKTPPRDIERLRKRLRAAKEQHEAWLIARAKKEKEE